MEAEALFVQAMDSVEAYLNIQTALHAALREGFIDLAACRYALGMQRVSTSQLPARMWASKRITINADGTVAAELCIVPSKADASHTANSNLQRVPDVEKEKFQSHLLAELASKYVDKKGSTMVEETQPPCDPLQWFGGSTGCLRPVQDHFVTAVGLMLELANARIKAQHAISEYLKCREKSASHL